MCVCVCVYWSNIWSVPLLVVFKSLFMVCVFFFQPEYVDEQLFLTAAMENKLPVVEKYLSDGGNPDEADHVSHTVMRLCW